MAKFMVKIQDETCKGCGVCVSVCPKKIIGMRKQVNQKGYSPASVTDESACIGCASCAMMCPDGAIEIYQVD
ncbi:MAG: 4Fe-4S binding protein [Christensenellaceae bacterium]|jgi:2-oxoglutarate ferredoxin oxidoreductase subunit delta|nr:4Fe-4S binding protein [Christensenellaceae bacterium]